MKRTALPGLALAIALLSHVFNASALVGLRPLSMLVPSEGMGEVKLGSTAAVALKTLGWGEPKELRQDETLKEYYLIYPSQGVNFTFSYKQERSPDLATAKLTEIQVFSEAYLVAGSGLKIGDSWPKGPKARVRIEAKCVSQQSKGERLCSSPGIAFHVSAEDKITSIRIMR